MGARITFALVVLAGTLLACDSEPAPVRVGAVYPLSGDLAAAGADARRGVELAVDIVNGVYDLDLPLAGQAGLPGLGGAPIEVVYADHREDPEEAVAGSQLVVDVGAVAILGAYSSRETAAASAWAEEAGVPFLAPESTAPDLTERGFRWLFRTTAHDGTFVESFFAFLAELEEARGIAPASVAVVYEDSVFGSSVGALEVAGASAAGLPVAVEVPYDASAELDDAIDAVVDAGAPLVMQTSYIADAIAFMEGYRARGYRPEAILAMDAGFTDPTFVQTLGDDANYVISREVWAPDLAAVSPLIAEVAEIYRDRYGVEMTGTSARSFTGLLVLADAIDRAGSTEPEAIRAALVATDLPPDRLIVPWDGVRFDDTGQNTLASGIIVQILDQAYRTVWPPELATREVVWPMPPWE